MPAPDRLIELRAARAALMDAQASGVLRVRDQNGEEIEFQSPAQMARALGTLDREIAALTGGTPASTITFRMSKGL